MARFAGLHPPLPPTHPTHPPFYLPPPSLDRVNSARNFTNKLWNAGKFVLFNLEKVRGPCCGK